MANNTDKPIIPTIELMIEAKKDYTDRLLDILEEPIFFQLKNIYNDSKDLCQQENTPTNVLMVFQDKLERIAKWSTREITRHYQHVCKTSNCNYLDELIKVLYIVHIKTLSSVHHKLYNAKLDLRVPTGSQFVHSAYLDISRELYKAPYLLSDHVDSYEYQKNLREVRSLIRTQSLYTLRRHLPINDIVTKYLDLHGPPPPRPSTPIVTPPPTSSPKSPTPPPSPKSPPVPSSTNVPDLVFDDDDEFEYDILETPPAKSSKLPEPSATESPTTNLDEAKSPTTNLDEAEQQDNESNTTNLDEAEQQDNESNTTNLDEAEQQDNESLESNHEDLVEESNNDSKDNIANIDSIASQYIVNEIPQAEIKGDTTQNEDIDDNVEPIESLEDVDVSYLDDEMQQQEETVEDIVTPQKSTPNTMIDDLDMSGLEELPQPNTPQEITKIHTPRSTNNHNRNSKKNIVFFRNAMPYNK